MKHIRRLVAMVVTLSMGVGIGLVAGGHPTAGWDVVVYSGGALFVIDFALTFIEDRRQKGLEGIDHG